MPVAEREHRAPQVLPAAGRWDTSRSRPTAVLIVLGNFPGTWTQADNTQRGLSGGSPHMLVSPGHRGCTCSLSIVSDSAPSLRIVPVCVANRHSLHGPWPARAVRHWRRRQRGPEMHKQTCQKVDVAGAVWKSLEGKD